VGYTPLAILATIVSVKVKLFAFISFYCREMCRSVKEPHIHVKKKQQVFVPLIHFSFDKAALSKLTRDRSVRRRLVLRHCLELCFSLSS
jgi:hypothetical protein